MTNDLRLSQAIAAEQKSRKKDAAKLAERRAEQLRELEKLVQGETARRNRRRAYGSRDARLSS